MTEKNIADRCLEWDANPDFKSEVDITVKVDEVVYRVPWYCLIDYWFYFSTVCTINKYEWADNPLKNTSIEMMRDAITAHPDKFKAFILY